VDLDVAGSSPVSHPLVKPCVAKGCKAFRASEPEKDAAAPARRISPAQTRASLPHPPIARLWLFLVAFVLLPLCALDSAAASS
jgi:hypothetical protein